MLWPVHTLKSSSDRLSSGAFSGLQYQPTKLTREGTPTLMAREVSESIAAHNLLDICTLLLLFSSAPCPPQCTSMSRANPHMRQTLRGRLGEAANQEWASLTLCTCLLPPLAYCLLYLISAASSAHSFSSEGKQK